MNDDAFSIGPKGIFVSVHLTPRASRSTIGALTETTDGVSLKVKVTAPPDKGKANQALLRLLAKSWKFPPSRLNVEIGPQSRWKVVLIAGGKQSELQQIRNWMEHRDV